MKRFALAGSLCALSAWAQTAEPAAATAPAPEVAAAPEAAPEAEPKGCAAWKNEALGEGPIALGYVDADVTTGRRVCPRSEVGLGARGSAVIDNPHFYGYLLVDAIVFGSFAVNDRTEVFGTLEAVHWYYTAQNGPLKVGANNATIGTLTLGATRHLYGKDRFLGALSARLLFPTSQAVPGVSTIGAEIGHASSWRPKGWLEVHSYLGIDFSAGIGAGPALPQVGAALTVGAQLSPVSFAALVVDLTGRVGWKTYFAPTVALRFRVMRLGIELAATLPLAGTDRHLGLGAARFSFTF